MSKVSLSTTRRVWAAVSAEPNASVRELAAAAGCGVAQAHHALHELQHAGYVTLGYGSRARRVNVPFILIGEQHVPAD